MEVVTERPAAALGAGSRSRSWGLGSSLERENAFWTGTSVQSLAVVASSLPARLTAERVSSLRLSEASPATMIWALWCPLKSTARLTLPLAEAFTLSLPWSRVMVWVLTGSPGPMGMGITGWIRRLAPGARSRLEPSPSRMTAPASPATRSLLMAKEAPIFRASQPFSALIQASPPSRTGLAPGAAPARGVASTSAAARARRRGSMTFAYPGPTAGAKGRRRRRRRIRRC